MSISRTVYTAGENPERRDQDAHWVWRDEEAYAEGGFPTFSNSRDHNHKSSSNSDHVRLPVPIQIATPSHRIFRYGALHLERSSSDSHPMPKIGQIANPSQKTVQIATTAANWPNHRWMRHAHLQRDRIATSASAPISRENIGNTHRFLDLLASRSSESRAGIASLACRATWPTA